MRIGYCSPFNPQKSGISDFSEELLPALAKHMELIVFSPEKVSNKEITENFKVLPLRKLNNRALRNSLDAIIYHVGNNDDCHASIIEMLYKYPGIVELHDVCLHNMVAKHFLKKNDWNGYIEYAAYCHGERGRKIAESFVKGRNSAPWEQHTVDMCMNRKVIDAATAVIVHSDFAKQMVLGIRPDVPISRIMLHSGIQDQAQDKYQKECRIKLNLPEKTLVFGSFGFATNNKRIIPILQALKRLKETKTQNFLYLIVGEAHPSLQLEKQVKLYGLEKNVVVTGFTSLHDFESYIGACDFCLNLRYPTQGESSASVHRILGAGKPIIVTDSGTFSEYPENIVIKTRFDGHEVDDIYQAICKLASDPAEIRNRGEAAIQFVKNECNLERNAEMYADFFSNLIHHTWISEYEDVLIGRLCEMGIMDEAYIHRMCEKAEAML